jgi:epoxyqueuosine reductase
MSSPAEQVEQIKAKALALGFDLCGIAPAAPSQHADHLRAWLAAGRHGQMRYLADRADERADVRAYFPPAKSVVCVAMNYHVPLADAHAEMLPAGRVARYALGDDYHEHIQQRLRALADWLRATWPGTQTKAAVDTAPVLERELAVRAGIGWQGKNTNVISPRIGSWIFLAEVLTSLDLPPDAAETDHCGTCTRCIDACPTGAITQPYELDATRCISYLTIEHRADVPEELRHRTGDWVYGCDVCQDVCPFNGRAPAATAPHLQPRLPTGRLDASAVAEWSLDDYHTATRRSAMRRVKLPMFQRNARTVLENASKNVSEIAQ